MYRRYKERRRRRNPDEYRRRSIFMRPQMQIAILLVTALVIFLILQSAGR